MDKDLIGIICTIAGICIFAVSAIALSRYQYTKCVELMSGYEATEILTVCK